MHRGHWQSKFIYLHDTGLNLWILADETGTRITAPDSIHHYKQRTILLDHVTYGATGLPGKLPKTNGTSTLGITEHLQHGNHSFPANGKKTLLKAHLLNTMGPYSIHQHVQPNHLPRPTGGCK